MPIAHIYLLEGRSEAQKCEVIRQVTAALVESLNTSSERVRVLLHEMPHGDWGVAGAPVPKT
jgi:4-oxalocrotonate tautomerase